MGYDNWKCTDPSLEGAEDWEREVEAYTNSLQYERDMREWLYEARAEDPSHNWTEDDYLESAAFENIIESRLKDPF